MITPVNGFSWPKKFGGKPGAGQVLGASLASQGVSATNTSPRRNGPVILVTVFPELSATSEQLAATVDTVGTALGVGALAAR